MNSQPTLHNYIGLMPFLALLAVLVVIGLLMWTNRNTWDPNEELEEMDK